MNGTSDSLILKSKKRRDIYMISIAILIFLTGLGISGIYINNFNKTDAQIAKLTDTICHRQDRIVSALQYISSKGRIATIVRQGNNSSSYDIGLRDLVAKIAASPCK